MLTPSTPHPQRLPRTPHAQPARHSRAGWLTRGAAVTVAVALLVTPSAPPAFAGDLAQVVTAEERVANPGEETVIERGHVDIGALVQGSEAAVFARDDSAPNPVWRHPDDVVFKVGDNALQTLPDNDDFAFVGAKPGSQVWVVPQTEAVGVPWVGWNTQAPSLQQAAVRGVNMELVGHSGPGEFALFLQNGGFEPPQILWSTKTGQRDPFWVDLNTHTHANWTFTEPGVHQVKLRVTGERSDGEPLSAETVLTFAVGEGTDPNEAQDTQWDPAAESVDANGTLPGWVWGLMIAGAAVLIAGVGVALSRRNRG